MPHAKETLQVRSDGTTRASTIREIANLFAFTGLHDLGPALERVWAGEGQRGRRSPFPATVMLAMLAAARVTGSISSAVALVSEPEVWQRCVLAYERRDRDSRLPARAPNRDQVTYFKRLLVEEPAHLGRIRQRFVVAAVGQARALGNLRPVEEPNLAQPDPHQCIYADGTILKPFSDVTLWVHPRTGEVLARGSRAQSLATAKIQETVSQNDIDGKTARGLNMVAVHTWTDAGRVVLATGIALGGEAYTALDLVDDIVAACRRADRDTKIGQIHGLIYDRAITGWHVDYLMGKHGIQTYSKAVAATGNRAPEKDVTDIGAAGRLSRYLAEYTQGGDNPALTTARTEITEDLIDAFLHIPLGRSYYPTAQGYDTIHSSWSELEPATHVTDEGWCSHRIAVDDGALFTIGDDPAGGPDLVKLDLVTCDQSTRTRGPDSRWRVKHWYTIPCVDGDFTYERDWNPTGKRHHPTSPKTGRAPVDTIGWRLRPLSRADDVTQFYNGKIPLKWLRTSNHVGPFSQLYNRRNDAESYNNWYQRTHFNRGRASSQTIPGQELDFLLAGLLNNSKTWTNRPH